MSELDEPQNQIAQGTEHEKSPLGPEGVDARIDELKAEKAALEQQLVSVVAHK